MNRRFLSAAVLTGFAAGLMFLASCDSRQTQITLASEPTVSLAPRISMSNGDSVLRTDSVRITVTLDGKTEVFKDTVVDFNRHSLAIPGVPVGSNYKIVATGLCVAADGRHFPILWQGAQTGTTKPDLGPVQWDNVFVNVKDTTSPSLAASGLPASGDLVLAFGSNSFDKLFQVPSVDTVYVGSTKLTPDEVSNGIATYTLKLKKDSTLQVAVVSPKSTVTLRSFHVTVSGDATSDTTKPTIAFVHPMGGDTVFSSMRSSYTIEVLPQSSSGIDSVVISSGGHRTRLLGAPWSVVVSLDPGSNPVVDTVFARNRRIASGSVTLTNPVTSGDSKPPVVRLLSPGKSIDSVDWNVRSVELVWKVSDSSGISGAWLQGQVSSSVATDSTWRTVQPVKHGRNVFRLVAKDVAGNSDTDSVVVVRREHQTVPVIVRGTGTRDMLLPAGTTIANLSWRASDSDGVPLIAVNGVHPGESKNGLNVAVTGSADSAIISVNVTFGTSDSIDVVLAVKDSSGREADDGICLRVAQKPRVARTNHLQANDSVGFDSTYIHPSWNVGRTRGLSTVTLRVNADTTIVSCKDSVCTAVAPLALKGNLLTLVVRDSAGDSTTDAFAVHRRVDASAPQVVWLGSNASHKDTVAMGTTSWQPKWNVTATNSVTVAIDGAPTNAAGSVFGTTVALRRSARPYDTIVRIVAQSAGITVRDSAVLRVAGSAIVPAVTVVGSRDVVIPYAQQTFTASWRVVDTTLDSVTINGVKVARVGGVFASTDSTAAKRDTFLVRMVATDSGGKQAFDSIRVRRLRAPIFSKPGGNYQVAPTVSISSNLAGGVLSWSSDKVDWFKVSTVTLKMTQKIYVKDSLAGVVVVDSALYLLDPVITQSWDANWNSTVVAVSDSGADSIEYKDGSNNWTRYIGLPVAESRNTKFYARAKLGKSTSNEVLSVVSYGPVVTPKTDSVYADSVRVLIKSNGPCDSIQYQVAGAARMSTTACQLDQYLTASATLSLTSWYGGVGRQGAYSFKISHDTSLQSVSLGAGMPNVVVRADGTMTVSDSLPFGTRAVTVVATPKDGDATVTYNGSTSGFIRVTNDTFTVEIVVENGTSSKSYKLKLRSRRVGNLKDERDGQVYPAVRIGGQVWMAKNLAYRRTETNPLGLCYHNDTANCTKYGPLYRWSEAMGIDRSYDAIPAAGAVVEPFGGCPSGWHLPSKAEFDTLAGSADTIAGSSRGLDALKSIGWDGNDLTGFGAYPAGSYGGVDYMYLGTDTWFWASSEIDARTAATVSLGSGSGSARGIASTGDKTSGFSVRCAMN